MSHEPIHHKAGLVAILFIIALAILMLLFNAKFFWEQVKYAFHKPEPTGMVQTSLDSNNGQAVTSAQQQPNQVQIPSLGITAPIVESEGSTEAAFQKALEKGVVRYPGTATAGQVGNMYLFGHSSDFPFKKGEYKTVFALLPNIQPSSEVVVTDSNGTAYTYKVYKTFVAKKTDVHLLDQNTKGKKLLTIQTSYPIGTALQRYIVQAELAQ